MMEAKKRFSNRVGASIFVLMAFLIVFGAIAAPNLYAQSSQGVTVSSDQAKVQQFGLIAAAVAFGFGAIGAGIAIANVGAAAMGAIGERPEIASQALIFIALAEGLVVFGFITALMILGKI
ncbi:hypothetical protein MASR2M29_01060 [Spirochaetota bacterium]